MATVDNVSYKDSVTSFGSHPVRRVIDCASGLNKTTTTTDVVRLFKLPPGARVVDFKLWKLASSGAAATSNATLRINDNASSPTQYDLTAAVDLDGAASLTIPATTDVGWVNVAADTDDWTVEFILDTAAAGTSVAANKVVLDITYVTDAENGTAGFTRDYNSLIG